MVIKRARPVRYSKLPAQQQQNAEVVQQEEVVQQAGEGQEVAVNMVRGNPPPKKRGPNKPRQGPQYPGEVKPVVWPISDGAFLSDPPCGKIVGTITKLAMSTMPGPIPNLHAWGDDPKRTLWKRFLGRYQVHKDANANYCREVMEKIAATGYCRTLGTAREECIIKHGWNTNKWKSMIPDWCLNADHWYGLCDYYGMPGYRKMCEQNKKNRGTIVTHHAGSASGVKHFHKLKEKLHRDPTYTELWLEIHASKGKLVQLAASPENDEDLEDESADVSQEDIEAAHDSIVSKMVESLDPASRAIYDKVQEMKQDPQHEGKPEALLFYIAYGGKSHGRIPGCGNKIDESVKKASKKRARPNHYSDSSVSDVKDGPQEVLYSTNDVKQLLQQQADFFAQQWAKRDERDKERDRRTERCFQTLYDAFGMNMPDEPIIDQPSDEVMTQTIAMNYPPSDEVMRDQQNNEVVQGDMMPNQSAWGNAFFTNLLASQR